MVRRTPLSVRAVVGVLCGGLIPLSTTPSAAQAGPQVLIAEFLASNDDGLADEDGERSDWLELLNLGSSTVALGGWYLTDDAADLERWRFPPGVDLPPGDILLVFASGKDRAVAGRELHTSFQLDAGGEFLALVRPDGRTVEHAYAPTYPPQRTDISYGITQDSERATFLARGSAARYLVPTGPGLGTAWTLPGFPDGDWTEGPLGIGFETPDDENAGIPEEVIDLAPEGIPTQSSTLGGFVATLGIDGDFGNFTHTLARTNLPATWELDLGATHAIESIVLHNRTSCCGSRLRDITVSILEQGGDVLLFESPLLNPENVLGSYPGGPPSLTVDIVDLTGGAVRGRIVRVVRTPDPDLSGTSGQGNDDEADVLSLGEVQVFGQFSTEPPGYGDLIRTDVEADLHGTNASIFLRVPFEAGGPDPVEVPPVEVPPVEVLRLRMRYDDGFVAYLNGVEIARRNAPAVLAWSSAAALDRPDELALAAEEINISEHRGLLLAGTNVLAIQGLNVAAGDTDFLILPELVGDTLLGDALRYFSTPTPGALNPPSGIIGFVAEAVFSVGRGFHSAPFAVEIACATPGATIRYTTDGTPPGPTTGTVYEGPLLIEGTTTLRATAHHPDLEPTSVATHTYIFLDDIVRQDHAATLARGFPSSWGGIAPDYGMDPDVIGYTGPDLFGGRYRLTIRDDLLAVPTLSIVLPVADMFGPSGIYTNSTSRGTAWERSCSAELILPGGEPGFQIDCGIRIQGGAFRSDGLTKKHSLRLLFKGIHGPTKLRYPLFGPDAADRFDTITLRAGANDGYAWDAARLTEQYVRDEFGRSLQRATGNVASHGTFVHLYIDGVYWGLYNPVERPDHSFSASYLGGDKDDWDALNNGTATNGNTVAWNAMVATASAAASSFAAFQELQGRDPDGARDPSLPHLLDVPGYADYMIVNFWGGNWDWPGKNYWATRLRTGESTGYKLFCWDYENTMGNNRSRSPLNMNSLALGMTGAGAPHGSLRQNPEYRLLFADRVQRLFFNDGVLTPGSLGPRYAELASRVERAMVAESARWGDTHHHPPLSLEEWETESDWILGTYIPQRTGIVLGQLRAAGLYPSLSAPTFDRRGGRIEPGFRLSVRSAAGAAYATTDGTDPRIPGGAVSPGAVAAGEVAVTALVDEGDPARVLVPSSGALGSAWTGVDLDDSGWRAGATGVGYERGTGYEADIRTDVEADMYQKSASVYVRVPFSVADPASVSSLTLGMKYDDGFVAHLNGQPVASANAPATVAWDSAAAGSREATGFETFDLTGRRGLLRAGKNVLALQGLNSSSTSGDLLILPTLVASSEAEESAILLDRTTLVRARALLGAEWSAVEDAVFAVDSSALRITEILYHPAPPAEGSPWRAEDFEFVEIQNTGQTSLNLTGMRLAGGIEFTFPDRDAFPEEDILPGEIVLVVKDPDAFSSRYGADGLTIAGAYSGRLANGGDRILLLDRLGETILDFAYLDTWYPVTDGLGRSLEIVDQTAPPATWGDPSSWTPSAVEGGTPGLAPGLPGGEGRLPGDINEDAVLDISDGVALLIHLFVEARDLSCDAGGARTLLDVSGDGGVDLSDAIFLLGYLFQNGPAPALGTRCVPIPGCADRCLR